MLCCSAGRFITFASFACLGLGYWPVDMNDTTRYTIQRIISFGWGACEYSLSIGDATALICYTLTDVAGSKRNWEFSNGTHSCIGTV